MSDVDDFLQSQTDSVLCDRNMHIDSIKEHLIDFLHCPRISAISDVLEFWNDRRAHPLYELACVALAVPATQASVERNFSTLKFIYTHLRCRLSEQNLANILFVNLNSKSA